MGPLPIILLLLSIGTGTVGIAKTVDGAKKRKKAKRIQDNAKEELKKSQNELEVKRLETNHFAEGYGQIQKRILETVVNRLIKFMNKNEIQFTNSEKKIFEGIGIKINVGIDDSSYEISPIQLGKDALKTYSAASAGFYGASSFATSVGTTAAGTSISGLSGVAGTNATMAYLGGGSLASGGGGMLFGKIVLGGVSIGAALLVGGLIFDSTSEKELTHSKEYMAKVVKVCAEMENLISFLSVLDTHIIELMTNAQVIEERATKSLNKLESLVFDKTSENHVKQFQETMILTASLIELIKTPVLNENGDLNVGSATIKSKHKKSA